MEPQSLLTGFKRHIDNTHPIPCVQPLNGQINRTLVNTDTTYGLYDLSVSEKSRVQPGTQGLFEKENAKGKL